MGNSSSGIKETPTFKCPTINIGSRQKNRLRGKNVIDVNYNKKEILNAIDFVLSNKKFIANCKSSYNPYGRGNVSKRFIEFIKNLDLENKEKILRKIMV